MPKLLNPALLLFLCGSLAGCGANATAPGTVSTAISTKAVPEHIRALKDEHVDARRLAAHCLWQIGAEAPEATPALLDALHDKDAEVRMEAARALGRTGQKESKVIAALAAALKDEDAAVRLKAVASLFELNEQATAQRPVVLPSLIEALRDKNEEVQAGAAILIGKFGQDAREAVPDLMTLLTAAPVIDSLNGKKPTSRESLPPMGTGAMNEQQMLQMKRMRLGPGKNP